MKKSINKPGACDVVVRLHRRKINTTITNRNLSRRAFYSEKCKNCLWYHNEKLNSVDIYWHRVKDVTDVWRRVCWIENFQNNKRQKYQGGEQLRPLRGSMLHEINVKKIKQEKLTNETLFSRGGRHCDDQTIFLLGGSCNVLIVPTSCLTQYLHLSPLIKLFPNEFHSGSTKFLMRFNPVRSLYAISCSRTERPHYNYLTFSFQLLFVFVLECGPAARCKLPLNHLTIPQLVRFNKSEAIIHATIRN